MWARQRAAPLRRPRNTNTIIHDDFPKTFRLILYRAGVTLDPPASPNYQVPPLRHALQIA